MRKMWMCVACFSLFAVEPEFPEVVEMGKLGLYQDLLIHTPVGSWQNTLAQGAFDLGLSAFNDSPEIGTFIALLQREYDVEAAVETGIYLGATTRFFSLYFDEVHSIELQDSYRLPAEQRLKSASNVTGACGQLR